MEWIILAFIIYAVFKLIKYKNNPQLAAEDTKKSKEELKNLFSSKKEDISISLSTHETVSDHNKNEYIDMTVNINLNSEKNRLLYELLKGTAIKVKIYHIAAIYKIENDKVIGFTFHEKSDNNIELNGVFEVKLNDGKFRAAEYDYDIEDFTDEKTITISSYHNPRTWERAYIKDIQIKTTKITKN